MHAGRGPDLYAEPDPIADTIADPGADGDSPADDPADHRPAPDPTDHADAGPDALELGDRRSLASLVLAAASLRPHARVLRQCVPDGPPQRSGADPVDNDDAVEPGQQGVVQVGVEALERGFDALTVEVE